MLVFLPTLCQTTLLNSLIYKNFFHWSHTDFSCLWLLWNFTKSFKFEKHHLLLLSHLFLLAKISTISCLSCECLSIPLNQLMFSICQTFLGCYTGFSYELLQLYLDPIQEYHSALHSHFLAQYPSVLSWIENWFSCRSSTIPVFNRICWRMIGCSHMLNIVRIDEQSILID